MQLSTSDWITIIATAVCVARSSFVAIGVAIWQVRRMRQAEKVQVEARPVFKASIRVWLLAQLWPFVASGAVALLLIIHALSSSGEVTRSFVISLVCGGFLLAFSLLSSLAYVIAAAFRPMYLLLGSWSAKQEAKSATDPQ